MGNKISDETYSKLSKGAYSDQTVETNNGEKMEKWKPIHPEGATLHDPVTGFDATVYRNETTKEIVIAYRGTEGGKSIDRSGPDYWTDFRHIFMGGNPLQDGEKIDPDDKTQVVAPNQFTQATSLLEIVKKEYGGEATITVTGHSLGGANAQYAAAMCDVPAVTYSAPGVYDMLPKEIQEKVDSGEYKGKITNYINPKDSISGGFLWEDKDHIGDTYMIDSNFKTATEDYGVHMIDRFFDSVSDDKDFHGLGNYHYDKFGNIDNKLIDASTGKEIYQSPRYSINGVGEVKVIMEYLEKSANEMKQSAEDFRNHIPRVIDEVKQSLKSTKSQRMENRINELYHLLDQTSRVYALKSQEVAEFIKKKADEYKNADENFQGFGWLTK
ncbi:Mbeg1-like protein [Bacillus arachidis]|uniref:DUF2974 domain-containing protein n=1 Tax=Bacillus arachidis TaxID=2819290 RepID=A0ABS3NVQ4_9BACI|nr:DUF2974 domain-containing protein [Bacillus arachidis]MBO1624986.1 DUF2974 domain-containing protein [Bacillus arachidis]